MKINHKLWLSLALCAFGVSAFAQRAQPSDMPQRIKRSSTIYLEKTTENSSWQNCNPNDTAGQDSTCVVPYRYAAPAGLATITADFTKANVTIGGTGTEMRWATTNAVSVTVTCSGVATYGPAVIPVQGNPSGIILDSAVPGPVTCVYVAKNSDDEPATTSATATFAMPVPPTISAGYSDPNPYVGGPGTSPIWTSTGAVKVYVSGCTGLPAPGWGPGYVGLQGFAGATTFKFTTQPATVTCTYVATNDIGQTATTTASVNFVMPPPPTVNAWFEPASITEGESSSFHWSSGNSIYTGIVCSGVGFSSATVTTPNETWYWFPFTYSTQGVQKCGVHAYNQAGQLSWVDAELYIYPAATGALGSPAASGGSVPWESGGSDGPGAGSTGCGGTSGTSGDSCSAE